MNLVRTGQFKKDYKRVKTQGKDLEDLRSLLEALVQGKSLPRQYHKKYAQAELSLLMTITYKKIKSTKNRLNANVEYGKIGGIGR